VIAAYIPSVHFFHPAASAPTRFPHRLKILQRTRIDEYCCSDVPRKIISAAIRLFPSS
jgi:hypothetical protein